MISSVAVIIRRAFGQQVARTNAGQASARLGHRRREREAVDSYLAELSDERNHAADAVDLAIPTSRLHGPDDSRA